MISRSLALVFKNRDRFSIIADILKAIRTEKGKKKTEIMRSANLSYSLANKYLDLLLRNGYVILEDGNVYRATRKGLGFLQNLQTEYLRLQFRR